MAHGGESDDFYAVLGLDKECTPSELRNAYKRLALKWHPDRCSASGNSKFVEDAKKKFQAIQQAYSVLSDENKRLMYDVGVYDSDDDENGMGDFLNEMATMMSQTKPNENGEESFQQLQDLFNEMFQENIGTFGSTSHSTTTFCSTSSSIYTSYSESSSSSNKRSASQMSFGNAEHPSSFDTNYKTFCLGVEQRQGTRKEKRGLGRGTLAGDLRSISRHRFCRKQKVSTCHDVSINDSSSVSADW